MNFAAGAAIGERLLQALGQGQFPYRALGVTDGLASLRQQAVGVVGGLFDDQGANRGGRGRPRPRRSSRLRSTRLKMRELAADAARLIKFPRRASWRSQEASRSDRASADPAGPGANAVVKWTAGDKLGAEFAEAIHRGPVRRLRARPALSPTDARTRSRGTSAPISPATADVFGRSQPTKGRLCDVDRPSERDA